MTQTVAETVHNGQLRDGSLRMMQTLLTLAVTNQPDILDDGCSVRHDSRKENAVGGQVRSARSSSLKILVSVQKYCK
jgi:hypothetical protein